jgi:hypothetical protein
MGSQGVMVAENDLGKGVQRKNKTTGRNSGELAENINNRINSERA